MKWEIFKLNVPGKYGKIVSKLIDAKITGNNDGIDDYICDTFKTYTQNKKKIEIYIHEVLKMHKDKDFINSILVEPKESEWPSDQSEFIRRDETDKTNLVNPRLIEAFDNLEEIKMMMNPQEVPDEYYYCYNIYTFSLLALLSIIEGTGIKTVVMTIQTDGNAKTESWFKALWRLYSEEIIEKYQDKNYEIQLGHTSIYFEQITINKMK